MLECENIFFAKAIDPADLCTSLKTFKTTSTRESGHNLVMPSKMMKKWCFQAYLSVPSKRRCFRKIAIPMMFCIIFKIWQEVF